MRNTITVTRRLLAPLTALALFAVACGAPGSDVAQPSPDGDAAGGTEPVSESETAPTEDGQTSDGSAAGGEPIQIGVLAPVTGTVAASGQDMLDGWNLYWEVNGDEVAGRTIETHHADSAGDPATALNQAERLAGSVGVDFFVGNLLANVGLAVSEAMSREGIPVFNPIASADDLTQRQRLDGVIRVAGWTSSQTAHPAGQYAYDQGYRRIVTLCTDYAFGHENCGGFVNTFTDAGGEIIEQLWNPLGTQDFSTYIAQIQAADPDAAFVLAVGADSVRFVQAWNEFGLKDQIPMIGGETTLDQSLLRNMGDEALGLISTGHFAEGRDSPATQEFVDAYLDAYGHLPSYYSVAMYTAAGWVADAITAVDGDVSDTDAFLEAVRAIELEDTPMGPMSLDDYDNPILDVYIREVEERDDGLLWNVPTETFEEVSQFWTYDPEEFLDHPVYSRDYQGDGVWPEPNPAG